MIMVYLLVFEIIAWQGLRLIFQSPLLEPHVCEAIAQEMRKVAEKDLPNNKYFIVCENEKETITY